MKFEAKRRGYVTPENYVFCVTDLCNSRQIGRFLPQTSSKRNANALRKVMCVKITYLYIFCTKRCQRKGFLFILHVIWDLQAERMFNLSKKKTFPESPRHLKKIPLV